MMNNKSIIANIVKKAIENKLPPQIDSNKSNLSSAQGNPSSGPSKPRQKPPL